MLLTLYHLMYLSISDSKQHLFNNKAIASHKHLTKKIMQYTKSHKSKSMNLII